VALGLGSPASSLREVGPLTLPASPKGALCDAPSEATGRDSECLSRCAHGGAHSAQRPAALLRREVSQNTPNGRRHKRGEAQWRPNCHFTSEAKAFTTAVR